MSVFRNKCPVAGCAARVNNVVRHMTKVHKMNKDEVQEFFEIVDQGRAARLRRASYNKITYRCSQCNMVVSRLDHHIKKRHGLRPFTPGKICIYLSISCSLSVRLSVCPYMHFCNFLSTFIYQ